MAAALVAVAVGPGISGQSPGDGALRLETTPAGGYRQTAPAAAKAAPALPTYQPDLSARLAGALDRARHENKRVLILWGSNTDKASQDFILTTVKNSETARTLLYEYEQIRAEVKGNEQAAAKYRTTVAKDGMPYLTVLDAAGEVLANQPALPFKASGDGAAAWDGPKLNEFLVKFKATYVAAEPLFASALGQAKRENKTLFLWFNAPW
jgi:hypothetical protein